MKIITANTRWDVDQLTETLKQNLNRLFKEARQTDIEFDIYRDIDNNIIIDKPGMYDGYLFKINAQGNKLYISKSEHYVDDVNLLTLQSIIETLQMETKDGEYIIYISGE